VGWCCIGFWGGCSSDLVRVDPELAVEAGWGCTYICREKSEDRRRDGGAGLNKEERDGMSEDVRCCWRWFYIA